MIADFRKVWAIFTRAEKYRAVWMLVLVILMALSETLGVVSILPFLSALSRPEMIHENPLFRHFYDRLGSPDTRSFIVALGLMSMAVVIGSAAFKIVTLHVLNRFVQFERHSLSSRLLSRYLQQPYEFFLSHNAAVLGKNVLSEVDQLVFDLLQPISQLLAQGTIVMAMALLIFCYDARMALGIVLTLATLYGAIYRLVRNRLARIGRERQAADAQRYQSCSEALGGIKDVKVTHSANAYLQKFQAASRVYSRHLAANDTLSQSPLYIVEAIGYSGLIFIALALLLRTNDIARVLPALGLYGFAAYRMLPAAQVMYRGFAKLRLSAAALNAISGDLTLPEEGAVPDAAALPLRNEIRLKGVRYAYPSTPHKPVLDNFDLTIRAETTLGIVGKTGAGKSTVMDILLGLLRPQEGTLTVDGVAIDADNIGAWQRTIGYVPQHIYLADASVAENIAFGVPAQEIDLRAVERAARAAQIHDFVVNELPRGYDTAVGDRGIRLSGGQRQRVGIARALYRDPAVLFMDEATSALDAQTETELNEAIRSLSGNKTVVVIAHREASLRYCQQIVSIVPVSHRRDVIAEHEKNPHKS